MLKKLLPGLAAALLTQAAAVQPKPVTVPLDSLWARADQQCRTPETALGELSLWERNNFGTLAGLPGLGAHEQIHYLSEAGQ